MSPRRISRRRARVRAGRRGGGRAAEPRLVLQVGPLERDELDRVGEVEQAADAVHLLRRRRAARSAAARRIRRRHRVRDLEPHRLAEAPSAQLELDRLEQVVGLVRDLEVGVAGHAERRALDDLHLREERGEVVRDHALERDPQAALAELEEARQALGHLDAREALLAGLRVADEDAEAEREPRDVGERLPRPDGERRQHRDRPRPRSGARAPPARPVAVVDLADHDPLARPARAAAPSTRRATARRRARRRARGSRRASPAACARRATGRRGPTPPGR